MKFTSASFLNCSYNRCEKEMRSCSAILAGGATEINRKFVEQGHQDRSLPEKPVHGVTDLQACLRSFAEPKQEHSQGPMPLFQSSAPPVNSLEHNCFIFNKPSASTES
ncbi:uncharacterized protein LJ206_010786 isoform 1-T2 [Theristicus caerulescens]